MAVGLVPFYEPSVPPDALYDGDGRQLAEEYAILNEIAAEEGLQPLSRFAQNAAGEFEGTTQGTAGSAELDYYPITDGLASVDGLLHKIRSMPTVASRLSDEPGTLEELEELRRSLRAAHQSGAQFCLFFM